MSLIRGAVLGAPVSHSLSPLLHRSALEFLGINGEYERREVPLGGLDAFFASEEDRYNYLSITMPLKEEALSLDVEVDDLAKRVRSANTLYRRDGRWNLTTTDGQGLVEALHVQGFQNFDSVLILGAGGTARAVAGSLDLISHNISVLGRSSTRRDEIESVISHANFEYLRWSDDPSLHQYDLVVNTTPAGAADLLADSLFGRKTSVLFDVIYKPWPTVLASRWADTGGTVINGLEMLLYQGLHQLELVLDCSLDHQALSAHLRPILKQASK